MPEKFTGRKTAKIVMIKVALMVTGIAICFISTSGKVVAGALLARTGLQYLGGNVQAEDTTSFTLFTTTDEHQYLLPYNYMEDAVNENIGLSKVMTLFEQEAAGRENPEYFINVGIGDVTIGDVADIYL